MTTDDFRIVHFIPGRLRARMEKLKKDQKFRETVHEQISNLGGINTVEINQETGSILITYDKELIKQPEHMKQLKTAIKDLFPSVDIDLLEMWLTKS